MSEAMESPGDASGQNEPEKQHSENPHAESVRKLAGSMLRTALWPGIATVALGVVIATAWVGIAGLIGSLIGGVVAFASSLTTIWLMRWTGGMPPMFVMVVALGGYIGKMVILLAVMTLLGGIEGIHTYALALTMLVTILVWAGAEVRGFQKARVPTIIPST